MTATIRDDFALFYRKKPAWDEDLIIFLQGLRLNFVVPIVSGLNGPPHRLLRAKVASFEKTWARVACVLSVSTSFQAVAALWIAAVPPNKVVTLGSSTEGLAMSNFMPLFSSAMMILRVRTALLFSDTAYLDEFRSVIHEITQSPALRELRVVAWKIRVSFTCVTFACLSGPCCTAFSLLSVEPDGWRNLHFYASILDGFLHCSAYLFVTSYVLLLSFHVVLPLLKITVKQFEHASETIDVLKLEEAILSHETCCRLIASVDRIASWLFGTILSLAVPHIAITFSSLSMMSNFFWHFILFVAGSSATMISIMYAASAIHQKAHEPEDILSSKVYKSEIFDRVSSRFTRRFRSKMYGYTFLGILTIRKQTILAVINIITTYLIVAMQFE